MILGNLPPPLQPPGPHGTLGAFRDPLPGLLRHVEFPETLETPSNLRDPA